MGAECEPEAQVVHGIHRGGANGVWKGRGVRGKGGLEQTGCGSGRDRRCTVGGGWGRVRAGEMGEGLGEGNL
jgi:hypothetical protein